VSHHRFLSGAPARAPAAAQVVAAVAAAGVAGAPFDVCVMDMYMERENGDVALAALRAAGHVALPVVLSTANATRADVDRYMALGFASVLGKPFSPEQLHAAISGAIVGDV
jgi:CheY-like chemotaxis protein